MRTLPEVMGNRPPIHWETNTPTVLGKVAPRYGTHTKAGHCLGFGSFFGFFVFLGKFSFIFPCEQGFLFCCFSPIFCFFCFLFSGYTALLCSCAGICFCSFLGFLLCIFQFFSFKLRKSLCFGFSFCFLSCCFFQLPSVLCFYSCLFFFSCNLRKADFLFSLLALRFFLSLCDSYFFSNNRPYLSLKCF